MLYTRINCGFRQVVGILEVINDAFEGVLGKVPSYNTIENWVKKCGLKAYEEAGKPLKDNDYAEVVDESMMIGSEKLLVTIGVPAKHQQRPLNYTDVNVLDIAVASSWNGEKIGTHLVKAGEKVGHAPLYVISDNASVMNKGVRCAKFAHQHDISHSLGMHLERTYKDEPDFTDYLKQMSKSKAQHNMKEIAYLLPPTQRTIARFINLSGWVEWSSKMLDIYHTLNAVEQKAFSFIPANAALINELADVVKCVKKIEYVCKHEGLSGQTVEKCKNSIRKDLLQGNSRMIELGEAFMTFLNKELMLVGASAHNNSSDILESVFGKYKARKSPNKLYGITSYILFVPIYIELQKQAQNFDFKTALGDKRMSQIDAWTKENLTPNLVQLRTDRLRKAG